MNGARASIPHGDVLLPAMVIRESCLDNNLEVMARYVRERGCFLAPHGKTTMAPQLFRRQLEHGAWGITVANVAQARVALTAGPGRILIANEIVGPADIAQLAGWTHQAGPEIRCLVDSVTGVRILDGELARAGVSGRVPVLVEVGVPGARTGTRSRASVRAIAEAANASGHVALTGVEGYEGVIGSDRHPGTLARVDRYLKGLRDATLELARSGAFSAQWNVVLSAGGSKYFDRVAETFRPAALPIDPRPDVVIRAGAYITHDHGIYARVSPLAGPDAAGRSLLPALEVWADVISVPEPGRAIVAMGKRDVPFDLDLPVPLHAAGRTGRVTPAPPGLAVVALDDQHCYLDMAGRAVAVGDRLGFGVSHPCTAFDKWRQIAMVDADYNVVSTVSTYF
ncbi:MAG TPA: alanine racemase [Streptosporangiaceae bacterium]|nr:alanine racemase [Streptosporangiaceae bacterium]